MAVPAPPAPPAPPQTASEVPHGAHLAQPIMPQVVVWVQQDPHNSPQGEGLHRPASCMRCAVHMLMGGAAPAAAPWAAASLRTTRLAQAVHVPSTTQCRPPKWPWRKLLSWDCSLPGCSVLKPDSPCDCLECKAGWQMWASGCVRVSACGCLVAVQQD